MTWTGLKNIVSAWVLISILITGYSQETEKRLYFPHNVQHFLAQKKGLMRVKWREGDEDDVINYEKRTPQKLGFLNDLIHSIIHNLNVTQEIIHA